MKTAFAITVFAAAFGFAGCAATNPQADAQPTASKEKIYVTGSRLPRKDLDGQPVRMIDGDAWRRDSTPVVGNAPRGN